ncbi:MAG: HlyD family efflux transporter periplasmic adaptor subunit, partial [Deltaproteobacteria bacterium]
VRSGQQVRKGDLLVRLKNVELQAKLLAQRNLLQEKQKQRAAIAAQLSEPATAANPATEVELRGKYAQLAVEIEGTAEQVKSLTRQVEDLSVRSPITGVVATFRIEEMLRERPVKRGELLLEVMDPSGPWRLELDVPENRLGHILVAQHKHEDGRLPLRYVLATATESTYEGSLDSISTRSVISETEGSVVPLFASLAEPVPPDPRIGAEVIAKIDCGRRSLGYVLFGDVIEFVRKRFWL